MDTFVEKASKAGHMLVYNVKSKLSNVCTYTVQFNRQAMMLTLYM